MVVFNEKSNKDQILAALKKIDTDADFVDTYFNVSGDIDDPVLEAECHWNNLEPELQDKICGIWNKEF